MVARTSNTAFLTVLDSVPLEGVGWYVRVLSERDYVSQLAEIHRFSALGFTVEANAEGGARITLDADDRVFSDPLPAGEGTSIVEQEALWQIIENGIVRAEFLAEDVTEDVLLDKDGPRSTVVAGRGTASVLEWARVLPEGMPAPVSTERTFTGHPMAVWRELFLEAQADGYLEWVRLTFSAAEDSQGVAWGAAQTLTVRAGDDLLTLLKRWCEQNELAWRMLPGFRLQVVQAVGHRREAQVVFTQHRAQHQHQRAITRRDVRNVVYADGGDLGIAVAENSTSQAKWRRRAAWVSAGDSGDATARSAVANATLALSKDQRSSRTVKVPADRPNRQPFVDFDVHDWITIELEDGAATSGSMRVMGIAVDIDATGLPDVELTLQSLFEARAIKLQRALDNIGGSSSGGAGATQSAPIPVSKALAATKLTDLADVDVLGLSAGDILLWDGAKFVDATPTLELLADVDATGPADGDALRYETSSGLWVPGAVDAGASEIGDLSDVDTSTTPPAIGDTLMWDGSNWVPGAPSGGGGSAIIAKQEFPRFNQVTNSLGSTFPKGQRVRVFLNATLTKLTARLTTVAGKTYRFGFYRVSASNTVLQVLGTVDVASPGAITGHTLETGPVSFPVLAGEFYATVVWTTDSSSFTSFYDTSTTTHGPVASVYQPIAGQNGIEHAGAFPIVVGTTLMLAINGYCVGFEATLG